MTTTAATAPFVRRRPPADVRRKRFLIAVANHSILIAIALAFLAPFVFILLTSLMTTNQALSAQLWPHPFRLQNFAAITFNALGATSAWLAIITGGGGLLAPVVAAAATFFSVALIWVDRTHAE